MQIDWGKAAIGFVGATLLLLGLSWLVKRWPRLRLPVLGLPCAAGAYVAYGALTAPHGYVVPYFMATVWALAVLFGLTGVLLAVLPVSRRAGLGGIATCVILLLSFHVVYLAGYGLGLHTWKENVRITGGTLKKP